MNAHLVNFRQSPKFQEFRALLGGFFAKPPVAKLFEAVTVDRLG